jgi:hypothetical protein
MTSARQALVLALACICCICLFRPSPATANGLLDLATRDLAETRTITGITLVFDPGKIVMVYALPGKTRTITNVVGLAGGPQEIDEPVDTLLERLDLKSYFIRLTLPDGVAVWVKAFAISFFRATEPWDHTPAEARSSVNAGPRPIFVRETVPVIKDAINAVRRQNREP